MYMVHICQLHFNIHFTGKPKSSSSTYSSKEHLGISGKDALYIANKVPKHRACMYRVAQ